ncbi:MAG: N-acetylmuramoyl-L-alanine amidase [Odoribacter sp.]
MIIRYGAAGILFLFLTILFTKESISQPNLGQIKCICIDPGHGGKDPGACGLKSYEKDIVLNLSLKVGQLIKDEYPEIKVVYTRDKDVFIDLDKRGRLANTNNADLFVSIHINSNDSRTPHGLETYVLGLHRSKENLQVAMKENSVIKYEKDYSVKYAGFDPSRAESYIIFSLMQNLYLEKSLRLAAFVQEEMVGKTKRTDRGVRQAGYLVLKDAAMPAILVEAGFISNPEEERYLNTESAQDKIAHSIFQAISKYKISVEKNNKLLSATSKNQPSENKNENPGTETDIKNNGPFYAVQVASAVSKIKNVSRLCKGEEVYELESDGRYRYYVGQSDDLNEVKNNLLKIKNKVQGCFIIAIYNGHIISVAEAKKLD